MDPDEFKYKSRVFEIVPNTKRNQELRAKRIAEENQRKQEAEKVFFNFFFFSIIFKLDEKGSRGTGNAS